MTQKRWIIALLLIVATILLIWEALPQRKTTQNFFYRFEESDDALSECILSSGITEMQWELSYPESLEMKHTDRILLAMYPVASAADMDKYSSACGVILATRFEGENATIEPGDTLFFAFNRSIVQRVNWDITAISADINAKIWIYAITDTGSTNEVRTALFVIPITIQAKSILGMDPQIIRITAIFFSLLAAGITGMYGGIRKPE